MGLLEIRHVLGANVPTRFVVPHTTVVAAYTFLGPGKSQVPHGKIDPFPGPGLVWMSPESSMSNVKKHSRALVGGVPFSDSFPGCANVKFFGALEEKLAPRIVVLLVSGCWWSWL